MMKRWYEITPEVCMLISQVELALGDDRIRYAKKILHELIKSGYEPDSKRFESKYKKYSMERWYDADKTTFLAFEYLKDADKTLQKCIAKNVHDYIMASKQALPSML